MYHMRLVYKNTDKHYMSLDLPKDTYIKYAKLFLNGYIFKGIVDIVDDEGDTYFIDFNRAEIDYMFHDGDNLSDVDFYKMEANYD